MQTYAISSRSLPVRSYCLAQKLINNLHILDQQTIFNNNDNYLQSKNNAV